MIAMFCEQRWRNNYFSSGVKAFCFNFALLWGVVFASNIGLIVSSFIICHVPKYQDEAEARYCRFFGNRTIAEFPEWQRAGWIMYHWTVVAIALSIACWQMFVTSSPLYILARADSSLQDELVLLVPHDQGFIKKESFNCECRGGYNCECSVTRMILDIGYTVSNWRKAANIMLMQHDDKMLDVDGYT